MKKQKIKIIMAAAGLSVALVGYFFLSKEITEHKAPLTVEMTPERIKKVLEPIKFSPRAEIAGKKFLSEARKSTAVNEKDLKYFNHFMSDVTFNKFFHYTLDFFGNSEAGFAAARFVSMTLIFEESAEKHAVMNWIVKDLQKNSKILHETLAQKRDQVTKNAYFHSRMLSLVHQLDVPREEKLQFFGKTIVSPVELNEQGHLQETSLPFETALILAKSSMRSPFEVTGWVREALKQNPSSEAKRAIQSRVLMFFPELKDLELWQGL